ncbi:MAG TPA: hypothetical protein VMJ13_02055 [Candidatus Acidoferrum sp.]|nr:hypothetical protein [Candidatus Acidoferrum sp.]
MLARTSLKGALFTRTFVKPAFVLALVLAPVQDACLVIHKYLNAAQIVRMVMAKVAQGPQSMVPAMIVMANRGQNDRPKMTAVWDTSRLAACINVRPFP